MEIAAGEFKAHCLKLMDEVRDTHQEIIITKRGKPVAKLVPIEEKVLSRPFFGYMKGTAEVTGDIVGPFPEEWESDEW